MARPRKQPEEQEDQPVAASTGKTVKLKYSGPPGQVVAGLGFALEEGESYDVPEELAEGLVNGSRFWEK